MLMATEADQGRRPAGKQRNNAARVLHNNKGMRCIHGWTSTVHPRLALLDSGCGVALLNSGCGVALLDSSFGVALLDMVLGPCSATTPATARSADLQRPVVMRRTFEAVLKPAWVSLDFIRLVYFGEIFLATFFYDSNKQKCKKYERI